MFGSVSSSLDKYTKIEQLIVEDLDNWLCNLYFEIEKVNLMDLKSDLTTDKLFFSPVYKLAKKGKEADAALNGEND
jgi:hypothetical protein